MVVLAGADASSWPVAMPRSTADWQAFEARHPDRSMLFWTRIDPGRGELELCSNVWQMPLKAKPATLFD